jgi:hypothetical protein
MAAGDSVALGLYTGLLRCCRVEGVLMSLTVAWLLLAGFLAFCFWRILSRVGRAPWPAFFVFVPFIGQTLLIMWLAFGRWPALDGRDNGGRDH